MQELLHFLLKNWLLFLLFVGSLLLFIGAVLNWSWLCSVEREKEKSISVGIYRQFGSKGYRIFLGGSGLSALIIVTWVLYLAYQR